MSQFDSNKDYYGVLGVDKDASQRDLDRQYKRQAARHHPDRGGNEEVVSDGRNGVIVPAQNVGSLARALRALADDEPWRRTLAAAARETARVFDLSNTVSRTEQLLLNGI